MDFLTVQDYEVHFLSSLSDVSAHFDFRQYHRYAILCDENSRAYCLPMLLEAMPRLDDALIIEVPAGEAYKRLSTCKWIWQALFEAQADRNTLLINLGGGVITDMGAFCAALYKRGIAFIQIPTTLLSQVDATIGGKTGVNFSGVKNGLGTFTNPKAVFIHDVFLGTLPEAQLSSGFAEMLKHAIIADPILLEKLLTIKISIEQQWTDLIADSLRIKQSIVEQDPLDIDIRQALNFGHTLGHALESYSLKTEQPLLHGHAIALGMIGELWLSSQKLGFPTGDVQKISSHLLKLYQPYFNIGFDTNKLVKLAGNDKKNRDAHISFTLLEQLGRPVIGVKCSPEETRQAFKYLEDLL
ncbi:MAG: 3-dehydroquinate synthase [Chitinophagales bacterium]|nr:3-dehydroquinate synthase [Chitinophagales bacterium]